MESAVKQGNEIRKESGLTALDGRGRFGQGGEQDRLSWDGAHQHLEILMDFGRGMTGSLVQCGWLGLGRISNREEKAGALAPKFNVRRTLQGSKSDSTQPEVKIPALL